MVCSSWKTTNMQSPNENVFKRSKTHRSFSLKTYLQPFHIHTTYPSNSHHCLPPPQNTCSIDTMAPCPNCNATGYLTSGCNRCNGTGRTSIEVTCSACDGWQYIPQDDGTRIPCEACGGVGSRVIWSDCVHCDRGIIWRDCPNCT